MKNPAQTLRTAAAALALLCALVAPGCVQKEDVLRDAQLGNQARAAFDLGQYARARNLIAQADRLYVPQGELWRRTLELRIAQAEGNPQGELRRFLVAWGEQRDDWSTVERAEASLAMAETLREDCARDFLREEDPNAWPAAQRTRYNLLLSHLQRGQSALRDDTLARWRLAINGLYEAGDLAGAAREARRCADQTGDPEAARLATQYESALRAQ